MTKKIKTKSAYVVVNHKGKILWGTLAVLRNDSIEIFLLKTLAGSWEFHRSKGYTTQKVEVRYS